MICREGRGYRAHGRFRLVADDEPSPSWNVLHLLINRRLVLCIEQLSADSLLYGLLVTFH